MQRQLRDSEAAQSAHVVIEQFSIEQAGGGWKEQYTVVNYGQTVADKITINSGAMNSKNRKFRRFGDPNPMLALPNWEDVRGNMTQMASESLDSHGISVGPGKAIPYEFSMGVHDRIETGQYSEVHYLVILYQNIFGNISAAYDCLFYNAEMHQFQPCAQVLADIQMQKRDNER